MTIGRVPGATGIQPSIVDAKGDLIVATAADSVSRLAVGTNNQVLTADSSQATGLKYANGSAATLTTTGDLLYASAANTPARLGIGSTNQVLTVSGGVPTWATPAGGAANWSLVNAGGTALTGATSVTVSGISGADKIMILIDGASAGATDMITVRLNSDTASNYYMFGGFLEPASTYAATILQEISYNDAAIFVGRCSTNAGSLVSAYVSLTGCNTAGKKVFTAAGARSAATGASGQGYQIGGYYDSSSAITSVTIRSDGSNLDAGTVFVYTSA